jgi:hypothetical protein
MIKPSDFLEPPQVMLCGLGLMVDSLCCILTLTRYRSHLHEKILYRGEPEAWEYEWVEPVVPVSTYSYVHRDAVYRTSRTHSRLPFAFLALARLADGLAAVSSLGLVHSTLAEKLQFSGYWTDATQPWFRINTAVAINGPVEQPIVHYVGINTV